MAQMLLAMVNFMTTHSVVLLANANMPATFPASVAALRTTFSTAHQDFLDAREDAFIATEIKVLANNQCYDDLITVFEDAQYLGFSEATLKQFSFARLLQMISGTGLSGIRGTVTAQATGLALANAQIELTDLGVLVLTDADGKYEMTHIPVGVHNLQSSLTGYQTYTSAVDVLTGTISTYNIQLSI